MCCTSSSALHLLPIPVDAVPCRTVPCRVSERYGPVAKVRGRGACVEVDWQRRQSYMASRMPPTGAASRTIGHSSRICGMRRIRRTPPAALLHLRIARDQGACPGEGSRPATIATLLPNAPRCGWAPGPGSSSATWMHAGGCRGQWENAGTHTPPSRTNGAKVRSFRVEPAATGV